MKFSNSFLLISLLFVTAIPGQAEFLNPLDLSQQIHQSEFSSFDFSRGSLDEELENSNYPIHPQASLTTGSLCEHPSRKRYPERINYCERSVESELKRQIIRRYDATFKYRIQSMSRSDFKIDHLIPLCMGGSNEENNLWPQYKKIYMITDPLEPEMCAAMSNGKILQRDAVMLILKAKNNLDQAGMILKQIRAL